VPLEYVASLLIRPARLPRLGYGDAHQGHE
jgi:hypothetical protein